MAQLMVPALARVYDTLRPFTEPAIRVIAGVSLAAHGFPKLFLDTVRTGEWFESIGWEPGLFWAILVGLTEFVGGVCLALGMLTRVVAVPILIFLVTAIVHHWESGFYWNIQGFEYPLFWTIVVFHFLIRGGGAYSIDALVGREV
jgi:putative oxidoreductase